MNKRAYRLVFSRHLGMLVPVGEDRPAQGAGAKEKRTSAASDSDENALEEPVLVPRRSVPHASLEGSLVARAQQRIAPRQVFPFGGLDLEVLGLRRRLLRK